MVSIIIKVKKLDILKLCTLDRILKVDVLNLKVTIKHISSFVKIGLTSYIVFAFKVSTIFQVLYSAQKRSN